MFTDHSNKMYLNYKLINSLGYMRILILLVGIFSGLLLIPDLKFIENMESRTITVVLRVVSLIFLAVLYFVMKKIKTFYIFSLVITVSELFFFATFLFVLSQYHMPDFFIQTLGLITLIIAIFLVPNFWINMVLVSVTGAAAYFIFSASTGEAEDGIRFIAAICYVVLDIGLCMVFAYISDKRQSREFIARQELQRLSSIDQLTEAANRFKLREEVCKWEAFCERNHMPICIALLDVDDLKSINDRHGHLAGDSILKDLVRMIGSQLRRSDVLARWGGDEFVILLPNATRDSALAMLKRIKKSIEEHTFENDTRVTFSFGIAEMGKDVTTFEEAINKADQLMYMRKKTGKNSI